MDFNEWVQSRLTAHGFPVGGIDGNFGQVTLTALQAFQTKKGLPVTGKADPATVVALRTSSSAGYTQPVIAEASTDKTIPANARENVWPRQKDMISFYGNVGTRQVTIALPYEMTIAWDKSLKVSKMTLHERCAPSAQRVLARVAKLYTPEERTILGLNIFGGSLNVRRMRGGSAYSIHSWGAAIDFDPERNGLNTHSPAARLSQPDATKWWQAWEDEGWVSLGRTRNFDWMHVQAARL